MSTLVQLDCANAPFQEHIAIIKVATIIVAPFMVLVAIDFAFWGFDVLDNF